VLGTGSSAEPTNQRSASQHVCPFHNISADGAVAGRRPLCCGAFSACCLRYPGFRLRAEADLWLARYLGGGPGSVAALIFWTDARLPCKEKQLGMRLLVHCPSVVLTFLSFYVFVALSVLLGFEAWSSLRGTRFFAGAFHEGILWSWLVY
jgi:hypothetical protein